VLDVIENVAVPIARVVEQEEAGSLLAYQELNAHHAKHERCSYRYIAGYPLDNWSVSS
jgi:hypothetical protein